MSQRQTGRARSRTLQLIGVFLVLVLAGGIIGFLNVVKARQETDARIRATSTFRASGTATAYAAMATALAQAQAQATANALHALQSPYPPYGGLLMLDDPLHDNSKGFAWGEDTDDGTCRFRSGAYYINIAESDYVEYCKAAATHFNHYAFQVQMTILKGDRGGLTFLVNDAQKTEYYFGIGQDGSYVLDYFIGEKGINLLKGNASTLINTGLNHPNLLAVVMIGSSADFYVNMQFIVRASNLTFSPNCAIGLAAQDRTNATEVVFNDAKVWSF